MDIKRIKCFLTGGHRFRGADESPLDIENDTYTVKPVCYKCGKQFTYSMSYSSMVGYAEYLHDKKLYS